jgi:predicted HD phosphohydrolase
MCAADRRHAVGVAREVVASLGDRATRPVVAAALLHDVGKLDSGLGTAGRVAATIVDRRRGDGRFARYRRHDTIGAALLRAAGSEELTWRWAEEHHRPSEHWTVPHELADALKAADDD